MPADAAQPPTSGTDARVAGAIFAAALVLHLGVRLGARLWGALGTDAALWGLTAADLRVGAPALVPPGYPAVLALLHALGVPLVAAGWGVAMVAAAALPAVVYAVARLAGASRGGGLLGAAAMLGMPDAGAWAQQVQPDSLAALAILLLAGLLWQTDPQHPRFAWAAAAVTGLLPLVREHGVVLLVVTGVVLLVRLRRGALLPVAAALAAWWLSPLLVGQPVGSHPLDVTWAQRAGGALASLSATDPEQVPYVRELHRADRLAYLRLVQQGDVVGRLRWHLQRSLVLAWDGWLWLALAGGLALFRRRGLPALAAPLLAAAPALLIWSQRRHVTLLVPLAICVIVAALPARRAARVAVLLAMAALALPWPARQVAQVRAERTERARAEHFAEAGAFLCEEAPPGSLLGGVFQDVGLYCPLPRHDPDGTPADWLTFVVSDRPVGGAWTRVHQGPGALSIYRLQPDRSPRPCAGALPAPDTPHLAVDRAHAEVPGCDQAADAP